MAKEAFRQKFSTNGQQAASQADMKVGLGAIKAACALRECHSLATDQLKMEARLV
jgi:hypothetical protein